MADSVTADHRKGEGFAFFCWCRHDDDYAMAVIQRKQVGHAFFLHLWNIGTR